MGFSRRRLRCFSLSALILGFVLQTRVIQKSGFGYSDDGAVPRSRFTSGSQRVCASVPGLGLVGK